MPANQWKCAGAVGRTPARDSSLPAYIVRDMLRLPWPSTHGTVADSARRVVETERCTGCGACPLLDSDLKMRLENGYMRPVRTGPGASTDVAAFRRICPGVTVASPFADRGSHPILGPYRGLWRAHAMDGPTRHRGSSGGVLTALTAWNLEHNPGARATGATADPRDQRRTVPVTIRTKEEALAAAGSRYAPTSACSSASGLGAADTATGKPCEAAALRQMYGTGEGAPLIMSFFCAGTPSQDATNELITRLGGDPDDVDELWYRGRGWPGRFTAVSSTGAKVSTDYDDSWGKSLGPTVQWRCRLCADGMGESADLVAGDLWDADERGYPVFEDQDGQSVLIARTERGLRAVQRAVADGVIAVEEVTPDQVLAVQPAQVERRRMITARLVATAAMGLPVTRYKGFKTFRHVPPAVKEQVQHGLGTAGRLRSRGYDWVGGRIRPALDRVRGLLRR